MKRRAGLLLLAVLGATPGVAAITGATPLPADEVVAGKRVDAYPELWWQWANRKRWGAQSFQDPTGEQCGLNQSGPVWFLAGTDGTDEVRRRCRVPEGKHIFLPLITMLENSVPGSAKTCEAVKSGAAQNNEHVVPVRIVVDGEAIDIRTLRMRSHCFNAYAKADYLKSTEGYFPSATDGYWLMLAPLSVGEHSIEVKIRYDNPGKTLGDMEQDFKYQLQIGGPEPKDPEPESAWQGLEA